MLLAQGVVAFPSVLTHMWCLGCTLLWQEAVVCAHKHSSEIKLVGLRSITQGKLTGQALKGTIGSAVVVESVQFTDDNRLEAAVVR